jgi:uncharacterized membrane protein
VLVVAVACALRLRHLGTFSLWWDEIVHVWMARGGSFADVFREVKAGIPPGAGNAGAVPLDYVLLHAYLGLVPQPAPEWLEIYFRIPAFLYSCLAVPLLYAFGCRFLDRRIALVAALLLALSMPSVLYAAEARFYSLFVLTTLVNLYAFASLVARRDRLGAWAVYAAVNVLFFFSGLFSLLLLAVQYATLALLAAGPLLRRARARRHGSPQSATRVTPRREAAALLANGVVLAACVAAYLSGTSLSHKYGRSAARIPATWQLTWDTYLTFASDSRVLLACLVLLPVPLVWAWRRGRESFAVVLTLELSLLAVPLIVTMARWKQYYFHPRHALFLLPAIEILTAITLLSIVRALDLPRRLRVPVRGRDACNTALACLVVVATQVPTLRTYLDHPERFFARSKKTYDLRAITLAVRDAVASYGPRDKYLLVVQRNVMADTALAQYLRWYGLDDRVVLRGTGDPAQTLQRAVALCATGCLGLRGGVVDTSLQLVAPFGLPPDFQRLLGLLEPIGRWPGIVRGIGIVAYTPIRPLDPRTGSLHALRGAQLIEPVDPTAAAAPSPST